MVIRLKDGTQEYIPSHERFKDLVRDRLGDDALGYLNGMISELEEWDDWE